MSCSFNICQLMLKEGYLTVSTSPNMIVVRAVLVYNLLL